MASMLNFALENGAAGTEAIKKLVEQAQEIVSSAKRDADDLEETLWAVKNSI